MRTVRAWWWRVRIAFMALRRMTRPNIGDEVWYMGRRGWMLSQGVRAPVWTLRFGGTVAEVHERDFRKVRSLANYWHSYRFAYRFYMDCWHAIWSCGWRLPT